MSITKQILLENEIKVDDLSNETELSESGYEFLKSKVEKLNTKAIKWHVPSLELKITGEREEPIKRVKFGKEEIVGSKKYITIKITGDAPHIEGYTFIAKVQHTTGGENILNIAPDSPIKNLPEIFKSAKSECDVCKQNRERFNTFILQLQKEDVERFPDKKVGDLIQVGSGCLKRFLPAISINALIEYAQIIEELRLYRENSTGDDWNENDGERSAPNAYKNHINTETLMKYIVITYNFEGKYIPKSQSSIENRPTSEEALNLMFDRKKQQFLDDELIKRPALLRQAEEMTAKVVHWMKNTDFNELNKSPDWENYYHNLNVVAHASSIDSKNAGYLGGVFQSYLRQEKQKESEKTAPGGGYVGKIGEKIRFNGILKSQRAFPSRFGSGTIHLYNFEDLDNNKIKWFSSKNMNFVDGTRYPISAKVKSQEVDKYTKQPTTVVTHGKLEPM